MWPLIKTLKEGIKTELEVGSPLGLRQKVGETERATDDVDSG